MKTISNYLALFFLIACHNYEPKAKDYYDDDGDLIYNFEENSSEKSISKVAFLDLSDCHIEAYDQLGNNARKTELIEASYSVINSLSHLAWFDIFDEIQFPHFSSFYQLKIEPEDKQWHRLVLQCQEEKGPLEAFVQQSNGIWKPIPKTKNFNFSLQQIEASATVAFRNVSETYDSILKQSRPYFFSTPEKTFIYYVARNITIEDFFKISPAELKEFKAIAQTESTTFIPDFSTNLKWIQVNHSEAQLMALSTSLQIEKAKAPVLRKKINLTRINGSTEKPIQFKKRRNSAAHIRARLVLQMYRFEDIGREKCRIWGRGDHHYCCQYTHRVPRNEPIHIPSDFYLKDHLQVLVDGNEVDVEEITNTIESTSLIKIDAPGEDVEIRFFPLEKSQLAGIMNVRCELATLVKEEISKHAKESQLSLSGDLWLEAPLEAE